VRDPVNFVMLTIGNLSAYIGNFAWCEEIVPRDWKKRTCHILIRHMALNISEYITPSIKFPSDLLAVLTRSHQVSLNNRRFAEAVAVTLTATKKVLEIVHIFKSVINHTN
jgi:hypothetical protein